MGPGGRTRWLLAGVCVLAFVVLDGWAPAIGAAGDRPGPRIGIGSVCGDVLTGQDLVTALRLGCKVIDVDDSARIDLSQLADNPAQYPGYGDVSSSTGVISLPAGVTLESDRSPTRQGGVLYMSQEVVVPGMDDIHPKAMIEAGSDTQITGLRLEGYDHDQQEAPDGIGVGILVPDVVVDDDEIADWSTAGVAVGPVDYGPNRRDTDAAWITREAARIHITDNYIHDNTNCDLGYGIVVGGGSYALIDRNVFDDNKHDIAGDGTPDSGYIAELNFTLTRSFKTCAGDYGGHFDMHGSGPGSNKSHVGGTAGTYIVVRDNTFRGDQRYHFLGLDRRPSFDVRGTPTLQAIFEDNVTEAPSDKAVAISGAPNADTASPIAFAYLVTHGKLIDKDNGYGVDTSQQLAVGNFGDDGCSDVFVATGASWWYSPCGQGQWRYLNASSLRLNRLAFGDFNGDGRTDVFSQSGSRWLVSYGGTTPWTPLPAGSNIPMSQYRFGDFTGDGKTDIFRANGKRFYISIGGATPWKPLVASRLTVGQLRFCDFTGNGQTDVFSLADHQWSVSYGGATQWHKLNNELSSSLNQLVFGDFNGDGRCDIARAHGHGFQVSWGGTTPWQYFATPNQSQASFRGTLLGAFGGGDRTDVLEYAVGGTALDQYRLMSGFAPFTVWSPQNML